MFRPRQPNFKIRLFRSGGNTDKLGKTGVHVTSDYMDIETCVGYPVTYEESADYLSHLNFTIIAFADVLLRYIRIGQRVQLKGGFYADEENSLRNVFSGTVTRIKTKFSDTGTVTISVECLSYGFTRMGKDKKNAVYPDKKSDREFARKDTMSVKDIIMGIAKDNNVSIGAIDLSTDARKVAYDKISIRYQKDMSDWAFLKQLANDMGCTMWFENDGTTDKLYFMSYERAYKKQQGGISFLYPLQGVVTDIKDSEIIRYSHSEHNRPRILKELTVDEDITAATSVSRTAVYFDKETGEQKEAISNIEEKDGKRWVVFYELDESRVRYVNDNLPEIADKIRNGGPTDLPWGTSDDPNCASYYYTAIRRYEEHQAVFDRAFQGTTVTAKTNQDLAIRSQRTYKIRGILSYRSDDIETSFFLRGLKHIWDADGTWTELDFIR